jgi:hypothetical protein
MPAWGLVVLRCRYLGHHIDSVMRLLQRVELNTLYASTPLSGVGCASQV